MHMTHILTRQDGCDLERHMLRYDAFDLERHIC